MAQRKLNYRNAIIVADHDVWVEGGGVLDLLGRVRSPHQGVKHQSNFNKILFSLYI